MFCHFDFPTDSCFLFPIPHLTLFERKPISLKITVFCSVSHVVWYVFSDILVILLPLSSGCKCIVNIAQLVHSGLLFRLPCTYVRSMFSRLGLLFYPEAEAISFLRKVDKHIPEYIASQSPP
jgi:hypothetical protein